MCMSLFVPDFVIEHLICKQIFFFLYPENERKMWSTLTSMAL